MEITFMDIAGVLFAGSFFLLLLFYTHKSYEEGHPFDHIDSYFELLKIRTKIKEE